MIIDFKNISVSIIICTRNRPDLLKECIQSLLKQINYAEKIELLIIDNASDNNNTEKVCSNFIKQSSRIKYLKEPEIGLSIARNRGMEEAIYDWVCYMDDDALAHEKFIERLFYLIQNYSFDAVGGMFYPWYRKPKPKWLSNKFGEMPLFFDGVGLLNENQYIAGGICAFKKDCAIRAGRFPENIGMRGAIIGYGEENHLQIRMREMGYTIGFDSKWIIYHLVAEYKYTVSWHLKRFYAKGRDGQITMPNKISQFKKIILIVRAIISTFFQFIKNSYKLFKKNYYYQNYLIDSLSYFLKTVGKISA